jgi:uncharacterized protein (DUF433 family)
MCDERNHDGLDRVILGQRLPDPSLGQDAAFLADRLAKLEGENARLEKDLREKLGSAWEALSEVARAAENAVETPSKKIDPVRTIFVRIAVRARAELDTVAKDPMIVEVPGVCGGEPIIVGTRMPARILWTMAREFKWDIEKIGANYPHLPLAAIWRAIEYVDARPDLQKASEEDA